MDISDIPLPHSTPWKPKGESRTFALQGNAAAFRNQRDFEKNFRYTAPSLYTLETKKRKPHFRTPRKGCRISNQRDLREISDIPL